MSLQWCVLLFTDNDVYTEIKGYCSSKMGEAFANLTEAKTRCEADVNCVAIEDVSCKGLFYQHCSVSGTMDQSESHCILAGKHFLMHILYKSPVLR